MVSLNIAVSEAAKEFVEKQIASGAFRDEAEYIASLIEADRSRRIRAELEAMLDEGLRGPSQVMRDEEWDEIRQLGERILAEKKRA
jgi:Arc/MetJ-type ribon-helix-helix transcriptional regulator